MDLRVKVIPRASRSEVVGYLPDGTLKVKVAAVPEKGKANEAVIAVLAEKFGVPAGRIKIVAGAAATRKLVRIEGV